LRCGFHPWQFRDKCVRVAFLRRDADRLRPLDEAAAYARCHGDREDSVRVVKLPPRRPRHPDVLLTGEHIRRGLEARIDARESDVSPIP
jgi:hypothetical protein